MTDTEIDILEIKQTLNEMKKSIAKIENNLSNIHFEDNNYADRKKIDKLMNYYCDMKERYCDNAKIVDMCDHILADLHDEYIVSVLKEDTEY